MIHNKTFNVLSCLLVGAFFLTTKAYSAEQPNILLIISDDQGYGDFGFMGNTVLRTPQLDKLAASAAIFENYSTGVACSPGRAMLFTGRNHLSTGVWGVGARYGLRRDETFAPDDVVKEFFASADKNGDGMASKSEWDSARPTWKWLIVHIDKDKNGQLDRAEYKAFQDYKKKNPDWRKTLESQ